MLGSSPAGLQGNYGKGTQRITKLSPDRVDTVVLSVPAHPVKMRQYNKFLQEGTSWQGICSHILLSWDVSSWKSVAVSEDFFPKVEGSHCDLSEFAPSLLKICSLSSSLMRSNNQIYLNTLLWTTPSKTVNNSSLFRLFNHHPNTHTHTHKVRKMSLSSLSPPYHPNANLI